MEKRDRLVEVVTRESVVAYMRRLCARRVAELDALIDSMEGCDEAARASWLAERELTDRACCALDCAVAR